MSTERRIGIIECPYGKHIRERDWVIGDYTLTSKIEDLDSSKILVTHAIRPVLKGKQANALLYLYGHDHFGRVYKNYLDLGFLYRGKEAHGAARALFGCYWFIDIENGDVHLENHMWQLKQITCSIHTNQGILYIPYYWKVCPICFNEEQHRFDF